MSTLPVTWKCAECQMLVHLQVDPDADREQLARTVAQQVRVHFAGHGREAA
jgi:hypothetical protein